jgi:hypothetical protein
MAHLPALSPLPPPHTDDASARSESFSDLGSDEDIEMTTLEDIAMTPRLEQYPNVYGGLKLGEESEDDSDHEGHEDDVGQALLSSSPSHLTHRRAQSRSLPALPVKWQMLRLVIEVSQFCLSSFMSDVCLDRSFASPHHCQLALHRGASGSSLCE